MLLTENIRQAFNSLLLNKKRTFLTMIGIIIGLSSVLLIVSLGDMISSLTEDFLIQNLFNGNQVLAVSGMGEDEPIDNFKDYAVSLDDVYDFIDNQNVGIIDISSDYFGIATESGNLKIDKEHFSAAQLKGVSSAHEITQKLRILKGRFITKQDNHEAKPVAVISDIAAVNCFGSVEDCIGKTIDFSGTVETFSEKGASVKQTNHELVIVGVYQYVSSGISITGSADKRNQSTDVLVPFSYMDDDIKDSSFNVISFIVKNRESMPAAEAAVRRFLEEKFASDPNYEYDILNTDESLKPVKSIISIITGAFVIIAAVSLLVGGIGLMNTMLVSVTERTKEIGIKKALGAKKSSIRLQFLIESAVLCIVACSVGVFFGMLFGMIIESNMDNLIGLIKNESLKYFLQNTPIHVTPSLNAIIVSTLFSLGVGIIFGYYPANKGAKMQPVDALRYE